MADIERILNDLPDKTYYRIGEVAGITKVKPYVLRFWETEFKMMTPPKSRSKQRMYRRKDIETILQIKELLYERGFTIKGARTKLRSRSRQPAAQVIDVKMSRGGKQDATKRKGLKKSLRTVHGKVAGVRKEIADLCAYLSA